jgi:hypothetical protein
MSYEALLEELDALQKALPAAAGPADDDDDEDDEKDRADPDAADANDDDEDDDDQPMAKSFRFELDSGEAVEAIDATDILKSLQADLTSLRTAREQDSTTVEQGLVGLLQVVKHQGAMLKSLQSQIQKLGNSGSGRKSVTGPDADMLKAQAPELSQPQLLAKAHTAYEAGRITGKELSTLDVLLRYGESPDADMVRRILA